MRTTVIYNGLSSIICSAVLSKKGVEVRLLLPKEPVEVQIDGFKLSPYELPMVGVDHRDYDGDMLNSIGLEELKKHFIAEKDIINVVFGDHRVDFSFGSMVEDIARLFPEHAPSVKAFISELRSIEKKLPILWKKNRGLSGNRKHGRLEKLVRVIDYGLSSNKRISSLYDKYKLPAPIRLVFDSVLFVVSGSFGSELCIPEASRIIVSALDGVTSTEAHTYSLSSGLIKALRGYATVTNVNGIYDIKKDNKNVVIKTDGEEIKVRAKEIVIDSDVVKKDFVSNFQQFNSKYGQRVRYPMSMYFRVAAKDIPVPMSRFLIYVDVDESGFYSYDDIYVLRYTVEGNNALLRATTFVPYGLFDIDIEGHKNKLIKIKDIVEKLVPAMSITDYSMCPDPEDAFLDEKLDKMFSELGQGDMIYGDIHEEITAYPLYKGMLYCGKEMYYPLGFESALISGISTAEKVYRGLKN